QAWRYLVDAKPRFDAATNLDTKPIPPVSQATSDWTERLHHALRYVIDAPKQQDQGATVRSSDVFPTAAPSMAYWSSDVNRIIAGAKLFENTVVPKTDIFALSQPETSGYLRSQAPRYIVPVVPRLEGATRQDWFLYPNANPVFAYYTEKQTRTTGAMV